MLSIKIGQLAERAGIREKTPLKEGEMSASLRKTVPRAHGLRKTFTTLTVNARMDTIRRKMLEGHSIGIDSHYYKPSETDLLEEYPTKALDGLTINPENRLKRKVEKLEVGKSQFDQLAAQIRALEQKINIIIN